MSQSIELAPIPGQQGSLGNIITFQVTADAFPVPPGGTFGILAVLAGSIPSQQIGYAPIGAGSNYVPPPPYSAITPYTDAGTLIGGNVLSVPAAINNTGAPWSPTTTTPLVIVVGVLPASIGEPTGWGMFFGNSVQFAPLAPAAPPLPPGIPALLAADLVITLADCYGGPGGGLPALTFQCSYAPGVLNTLFPFWALGQATATQIANLLGGSVAQGPVPARYWTPPQALVGTAPLVNYVYDPGLGYALGGDFVQAYATGATQQTIAALFSPSMG